MSSKGQTALEQHETAVRPLVGFSEDYPAGFRKGLHSHPRAQVLHAVSGVMNIRIRTASFVVPPSTALILPAFIKHEISMDGPVRMRSLFLRKGSAIKIGNRAMVFVVRPLLRELILAACKEPLDWDLDGRGHYIAELAMDEIVRAKALPLELPMPSDARLQAIARNILADPAGARNLEDWADYANVSSRTLARLFRSETGMTFTQWRQHVRLTSALSALAMDFTPKQAAALAGFQSIPAFGVAFRKQFGFTPGQVREFQEAQS